MGISAMPASARMATSRESLRSADLVLSSATPKARLAVLADVGGDVVLLQLGKGLPVLGRHAVRLRSAASLSRMSLRVALRLLHPRRDRADSTISACDR